MLALAQEERAAEERGDLRQREVDEDHAREITWMPEYTWIPVRTRHARNG